jgi:hypothetical protein
MADDQRGGFWEYFRRDWDKAARQMMTPSRHRE